jgi:DNA-binding transcriptional regulator YhcF (GntR family)
MASRRTHSKVMKLPPRLRDAIRDALVKHGKNYDQVAELVEQWVAAGEIKPEDKPSRSGIARFGKLELARLEQLEHTREYARAVVAKADEYGMALDEAASNTLLNELMSIFMKRSPDQPMDPGELARIMTGLGKLQQSSAAREKMKTEFQKRIEAATKKATGAMKRAGLSKTAIAEVEGILMGGA